MADVGHEAARPPHARVGAPLPPISLNSGAIRAIAPPLAYQTAGSFTASLVTALSRFCYATIAPKAAVFLRLDIQWTIDNALVCKWLFCNPIAPQSKGL